MQTFVDNAGRTWAIEITPDAVWRVRERADVDLIEIMRPGLLKDLILQPDLLRAVLLALLAPEAVARGVAPDDLAAALVDPARFAARTALLSELVRFFAPAHRLDLAGIPPSAKCGAGIEMADAAALEAFWLLSRWFGLDAPLADPWSSKVTGAMATLFMAAPADWPAALDALDAAERVRLARFQAGRRAAWLRGENESVNAEP